MDFVPLPGHESARFEGFRIVLPVVSLSNAAQLACDLLITSLRLQRCGSLASQLHVPVVGAVDADSPVLAGVSSTLDVYADERSKLLLVQQRSPSLLSQKDRVVEEICHWLRRQQPSAVLALAGMDAAMRRDVDLQSQANPLRHILFGDTKSSTSAALAHLCPSYHQAASSKSEPAPIPIIPAGGLARRLATALRADAAASGGMLLAYVVEGDNRADAELLASAVLRILELPEPQAWQPPRSWRSGLFGQAPAQELFG